MHRRSFAWAAFAVGLLALISAPSTGVAPIHETSAVIEPTTPVLALAATESPTAPDSAAAAPDSSAAAPAQPKQVAAPSTEPAPVARAAVAARASAPAATCPVNEFCYPRVGIAGPIVPYGDCTGSTDVGTAIRSLTCLSPTYLAAHAYTQFGRIAGWRAGDVVFAHGVRYVIFDAYTQPGCVVPARPIAPLSLQTSLTSATCGPILVVQGRTE